MDLKTLEKAKRKSNSGLHSDAIRLIQRYESSNPNSAPNSPDFQLSKSQIFIKAYEDESVPTNDSYLATAIQSACNLVQLQPKSKVSSLFLIKMLFEHTGGASDVHSFNRILQECNRIDLVSQFGVHRKDMETEKEIVMYRENSKKLINSYIQKVSQLAVWKFEETKFEESIQIAKLSCETLRNLSFVHRFLAGLFEELAYGIDDNEEKQKYLISAFESAKEAVVRCPSCIEYRCFLICVMLIMENHDLSEILLQVSCLSGLVQDKDFTVTTLIDNWLGFNDPNRYRGLVLELRKRIEDVLDVDDLRSFARITDWANQELAKAKIVCSLLQSRVKNTLVKQRSIKKYSTSVENVDLQFMKRRVVGFWNSLDIEEKKSYLKTTSNDLIRMVESEYIPSVCEAIKFGGKNQCLKFYTCYRYECKDQFLNKESYLKHIRTHMSPDDQTFFRNLDETMPKFVSFEWHSHISNGQWKPIDSKAILTIPPKDFIADEDLWPWVDDPVRASLLEVLQELLDLLCGIDLLTEGHMLSMIKYSCARLSTEPELCCSGSHFLFCSLDSLTLRELINALVELFEVCSKVSERSDQSLVYGFENQGISLEIKGVELTVNESALGSDGVDFLDFIFSGPSFKELFGWWRSFREDRNSHAEKLSRVLTSVYVKYIKMQLKNKTEHRHDVFILDEADALLHNTHIAVNELILMMIDTAEDTYEELLLALMKSHIQEHLREAMLDSV